MEHEWMKYELLLCRVRYCKWSENVEFTVVDINSALNDDTASSATNLCCKIKKRGKKTYNMLL